MSRHASFLGPDETRENLVVVKVPVAVAFEGVVVVIHMSVIDEQELLAIGQLF
jgi:hypothetical protein